jgi:methylmalonyl-CoA mutase
MQEAGAPADLELAYTLADGLEYLRAGLAAGIPIDDFAPRLSFFFGVGKSFWIEVAKLRAARALWATLVQDYAPQQQRSLALRMHCQTSGWSLTEQDPWNNVARTCIEAAAAVFGGTQSLHTNALDEALALPSPFSARIARNTQLVLRDEAGLCATIDPLGGSYTVEALTAALIERATRHIAEIEQAGGMAAAIAQGLPKQRIEEAAAQRQALIDSGAEPIVGVNRWVVASGQGAAVELLNVDPQQVREVQCARLQQLRAHRDEQACRAALAALRTGAMGRDNLLALAVEAARARASLGEISAALEQVFGRHQADLRPVSGVYARSYADREQVAELRRITAAFVAAEGRPPRILIAKLGQDGHDRGARVVASALADFGFDVDVSPLFQAPAEAAAQAVDNDVDIVALSSLAAGHKLLLPQLTAELLARGRDDILVVAGGVIPPQDHDALYAAGAHAIFGPGTSIVSAAFDLLALLDQRAQATQA